MGMDPEVPVKISETQNSSHPGRSVVVPSGKRGNSSKIQVYYRQCACSENLGIVQSGRQVMGMDPRRGANG